MTIKERKELGKVIKVLSKLSGGTYTLFIFLILLLEYFREFFGVPMKESCFCTCKWRFYIETMSDLRNFLTGLCVFSLKINKCEYLRVLVHKTQARMVSSNSRH